MQEKLYRLEELTEATGISPRNVRYYTSQGLLPAPDARGRFALYTDEHLRRLRLIQRLKDAFLPLEVIRAQLAPLTDAQMDALLAEDVPPLHEGGVSPPKEAAARPPADSAAAYISRVLAQRASPASPSPQAMAAAPRPDPPSPGATSEAWERVTLAPGVELHARRIDPFVQKLIAYAKSLRPSDH